MQKFLLVAVLITAPHVALADLCKDYGNRAAEIMTFRQNNDKMSDVMARVGDSDILRELVVAAYEYPYMQLEKNKVGLIGEFRNNRELLCYQSFGTKKP